MGKARSFSNEANEIVFQTESNNENFALGSQQNSYNLGSVHFSDQSGIGNFSQSGKNSKFAQVKGSLFQGNIGFVQQTVELDVGTSTINLNNDATGAALAVISQDRIVTLSAGFTSDLTTITGAQRQGQICKLYNIFSNTITIKNNAGATVNTIVTPGATDFTLSGHGLVTLVFDISLAQWRIEGNLGSGGGANLLPLDNVWTGSNTFNGSPFTINGAITTLASTTSTSITSPLIVLGDSSSDDLQIVATPTFLAGVLFSNTVTMNGSITNINSANINLGDSSADDLQVSATATFNSPVTIDGSPFIVNGSITTLASVTSTSITSPLIVLGDSSTDVINFGGRIGTDIIPILDADDDLGTNILRWDNIFGVSVIANTVTASVSFSSTGTTTLGDDAADNIFFGGQVATQMVIEEISVPGTPPANTLTLYAKLDGGFSKLFYKQEDGTEVGPLSGAGGITNSISQLDSSVTVTDTGSDGLINFVTDGVLQGSIQDSLGWTFNANTILGTTTSELIQGAGLVGRDWTPDISDFRIMGTTALPWSTVSLARTNYISGGAISGRFLVNADGVEIEALLTGDFIELKTQGNARANFKAEADGGITFFEPFEINDEMRIDGGNMIHANNSVQCGFAVTDEVTSPGTEGTMQMPRTGDTTPTASELDADFGSALGCHGLATLGGLPATPIWVVKVETSPSTWRGIILNASGNLTGTEFT